jgi:phenylacetate-CoA ligase
MQGEDLDYRPDLKPLQLALLGNLLAEVLPRNRFYAAKYAAAGIDPTAVRTLDDVRRLPFTLKAELYADQAAHPPYGTNLTYPLTHYQRLHQTSGTSGQPLRWLDTRDSWNWMLGCWHHKYRITEVNEHDRLFFPFSFGPFLGFWTAFEAAAQRGHLCLAGGGMTSQARLRFLLDNRATVVLCTPTYALRLAEVAAQQGIRLHPDTPGYAVRMLIVAGEPGGSIPATRRRIEEAWSARVFDHSGMTETGPMTAECLPNPGGLHVLETEYLAEVIRPGGTEPMPPGEPGELVVTNFGRTGSPLIRYRTGDLVRVDPRPCPCGRRLLRLDGGILGRTDDMIHLRGNNVYPAALEGLIRRFREVAEYRVQVEQSSSLTALRIEVEPANGAAGPELAERVAAAVREELLFRADVTAVAPGSLPRFEMKASRVVRRSV